LYSKRKSKRAFGLTKTCERDRREHEEFFSRKISVLSSTELCNQSEGSKRAFGFQKHCEHDGAKHRKISAEKYPCFVKPKASAFYLITPSLKLTPSPTFTDSEGRFVA